MKNALIRRWIFIAAALSGILTTIPLDRAGAHGAVSMENDICKLKVAGYFMHFAGYQPDHSISEFCEDIPMTGRTIIVLDFIDDALRDMLASVQIIKQEQSGIVNPDAVAAETAILDIPPRKYPNGTITLNVDFRDAGNYLGVVTVGDRTQFTARFPFSVGIGRSWRMIAFWSTIVLAGAIALFFWAVRHRMNAAASANPEED
jgi:hypothetical protein